MKSANTKEKLKRLIKSLLQFQFWIYIRIAVQRMPLTASYSLARFLALPYYLAATGERKRLARALQQVYPYRLSPQKIDRIILKTFEHMFKSTMDKFYYPKMNSEFCSAHVKIEGLNFLDAALKEKKGVVLLHSHIGNPHWIMPAIGNKGYPLHQIASRVPPGKIGGWIGCLIGRMESYVYQLELKYKETFPVNFIYTDKFLRTMYRALGKNEILAIGLDGREGTDQIEVEFLNNHALFFTGMMRFLLRTNPVVLPTVHLREEDGTQRIIIEKPMELIQTGDTDYDVQTNIKRFAEKIEAYFYRYPWLYAEALTLSDPYIILDENNNPSVK